MCGNVTNRTCTVGRVAVGGSCLCVYGAAEVVESAVVIHLTFLLKCPTRSPNIGRFLGRAHFAFCHEHILASMPEMINVILEYYC